MSKDTERYVAEVPPHLKRQADADPKSNKDILIDYLRDRYESDGNDLRRKINEMEEEMERERQKFEEAQAERQEKLDGWKSQLEEIEEQKQDYTEWLSGVLDWCEEQEGGRLVLPVIRARDGFDDYRKSAEQVQKDLKDLARDQKRKITVGHFTKSGPNFREEPLYKQAEDAEGEEEAGEATNQEGGGYEISYSGRTVDD